MLGFIECLSFLFTYVGYIQSKSFEQPLTKKQEEKCIEALLNNDQEAREKLILHNLRLVAHIAKKYDFKKELNEDLISIGTIGLIKGIDTFNLEKGHKLTTYISRCIENEILMHLRKNKNYYQVLSLDDQHFVSEDHDVSLLDMIEDEKQVNVIDDMMLKENIEKMKQYLSILEPNELLVIEKRFGLNGNQVMKQKEIAKELKISRSYVSRIEKRAFYKLFMKFKSSK